MQVQADPLSLESFATFGELLKYLRRRARLTQRDLSVAVGYSEPQISYLEKNHRLPDPSTVAALFVPALGLEKEPAVATRLLELATSGRREDEPAPGLPPFKGLSYFDEGDAGLFFGREALTDKLVNRLIDMARTPDKASSGAGGAIDRFLAIVGASGSGKSSLVRAGLTPALKQQGWLTHIITPTAQPLAVLSNLVVVNPLANSLRPTRRPLSRRILVIVDQFEEVFTLCHDPGERRTFIDQLLAMASDPDGGVSVVITLRADFYSQCAPYAGLRATLAQNQEYIGPLNAEQLHRAVEEPARGGGWKFEPGLVDLLLADVGNEPGGLPLLSHALLSTWERRRGRILSLSGYSEAGGVRGAIAETAESVFVDRLSAPQQAIARNVFMRLTELGEGDAGSDTRRRVAIDELLQISVDEADVREVLNLLADARLITMGQDAVDVAHEALIREWGRLREWLEDNRESLRAQRHLTTAAHDWEGLGRDPGALYRGARLVQAVEFGKTCPGELNELERAFLDASVEQERTEEAAQQAQQRRELAVARELAAAKTRAAAQLRRRALVLAGALVLAVLLAGAALYLGDQASRNARVAKAERDAAQQAQAQAAAQQKLATSRELASAAIANLSYDPERSILLALNAVSTTSAVDQTWTREAEEALHQAVQAQRLRLVFRGHTDDVWSVAFSPDGSRLYTGAIDAKVKIWDSYSAKELATLDASSPVTSLAVSPDGSRLAVDSTDGAVSVWDTATYRLLWTRFGSPGTLRLVAYSPDGTLIASAGEDNTTLYDVSSGEKRMRLAGGSAIAFTPDGKHLVTGPSSSSNADKLWDLSTGKDIMTLPSSSEAFAFSPDGKRLAAASGEFGWETPVVLDMDSGKKLFSLGGHSANVVSLQYGPDGTRIFTGSQDGTARVWDAESGKQLFVLANGSAVNAIALSPECVAPPQSAFELCGPRLATVSRDRQAKVWDVSPGGSRDFITLPGFISAFHPDGKRLMTGTFENTALKIQLWALPPGPDVPANPSAVRAEELLSFRTEHAARITAGTFNADWTRFASVAEDMVVKIWDGATGKELWSFKVASHNKPIYALAFNPTSTRLVTASDDGTAKIWDLTASGKELLTLNGHTGPVNAIAYCPDGKCLATASSDKTVRIWDAETGQPLLTLSGHTDSVNNLVFNPDGTRLATSSMDQTSRVWDTSTGQPLLTLAGHTATVNAVAYSSDGKRLATVGFDTSLRLWDAVTGQELLRLDNAAAGYNVSFSPDGTRLAVGSFPGPTRIYVLAMQDLVALARARVTRSLTIDECRQFLHREQCP